MALGPRRTSYQQLGLAVLGLTTFALGVPVAWAQIAVSANDNKIVNVDGANQIVDNRAARRRPPSSTSRVSPPQDRRPAQRPGTPSSDRRRASPSRRTRASPSSPPPPRSIRPTRRRPPAGQPAHRHRPQGLQPPAVIATRELERVAPPGVSFSPDGKLALVANRGEGTVSVLTVAGKTLTDDRQGRCFGDRQVRPQPRRLHSPTASARSSPATAITVSPCSASTASRSRTPRRIWWPASAPTASRSAPGATWRFLPTRGAAGWRDIVIDQRSRRAPSIPSRGRDPRGCSVLADGSHVTVTIQNGSQRPRPTRPATMATSSSSTASTAPSSPSPRKPGRRLDPGRGMEQRRQDAPVAGHADQAVDILSFNGKPLRITGGINVDGGPAGIRTAER